METTKAFDLFKYIIEQETKDGKEFNLPIHNSTFVFKPIKNNIRLNDAKNEIIMTDCEVPDFMTKEAISTYPFTMVLKKKETMVRLRDMCWKVRCSNRWTLKTIS